MTVAAAREVEDGQVLLVGVGPPNAAANLARRLHAPECILVYESGAIGSKPSQLPLSIGDDELATSADELVSVPEMFNYWVGGGRIDLGFLGAAQIDRMGRLNTTVIGDYERPKVRLPGAGGGPEIAAAARDVLVLMPHSRRSFVERLDFVTTVADRARDGRSDGAAAARTGLVVVTDHGVLHPRSDTGELELTAVHAGIEVEAVVEATGWPLRVGASIATIGEPSAEELATLRRLRDGALNAGGRRRGG